LATSSVILKIVWEREDWKLILFEANLRRA